VRFPSPDKGYFKLSEVSAMFRDLTEAGFPEYVWIRAEIAKLQVYGQKGHCYLSLAEKNRGEVVAEFRANIWAFDFRRIAASFRKEVGEELKQGLEVMIYARPSFHPKYGLSLNIKDIDTRFSQGEMARLRQETVQYLREKGLYSANKQLPMPLLPTRIAVISDAASDGFSDFKVKLLDEHPFFNIEIQLFSARLQGEAAVSEISAKLNEIKARQAEFDLSCIVRGGGGEVGMSCYDHKMLSETIARHPLPVLTGIGHSTNLTVSEEIAWKNLITPTDLAYFIIDRFKNEAMKVAGLEKMLSKESPEILQLEMDRLSQLIKRNRQLSQSHIQQARNRLNELSRGLAKETSLATRLKKRKLLEHQKNVHKSIPRIVKSYHEEMKLLSVALNNHSQEKIFKAIQKLGFLESKKSLLDPVQVLRRGYSITRYRGKAITDAGSLPLKAPLEVELAKGKIQVELNKFVEHGKKE
jgi:exodeoxyribonuclease VII large subunit